MKFYELPQKHKETAIKWAIDSYNELYRENAVDVEINENSPEVTEYLSDSEYVVEKGAYEPGIEYERLIRL